MTTPTKSSFPIFNQMLHGIQVGGAIMLAQTPAVTSLNRVSVVSCYHNCSMIESATRIFQGKVDVADPSPKHFLKGVSGHLTKESARLGFKATGIVMKPRIDAYFSKSPLGKSKADLIFAGMLALAEMVINPADTLRTMWQAGERLSHVEKGKKIFHLYKGSSGNGFRQFGTWFGFPISDRMWSKVIDEQTPLDSHSISGIVARSFPQSFQITLPVWGFERLKNELQYHPKLNEGGEKASHYIKAFKHIVNRQGWRGFVRGFMPKVLSNTILVIGADYLLEMGKRAQKEKV